MNTPLIVGIDPGTTTAWAILGLDGSIIQVGSSKDLGLGALISIISGFGRPVIVGCDKASTPSFVKEFSSKFSSRIVSPKEDLKIDFKRNLARDFNTNNSHEMDALASALFARSQVLPLINKVASFVSKSSKIDNGLTIEEIFETVLSTGLSVKNSVDLLSQEEELAISQASESGSESSKKSRLLLSIVRSNRKEIDILHDRIDSLEAALKQTERELAQSKLPKTSPIPSSKSSINKDKTISRLSQEVSQRKKDHQIVISRLSQVESVLRHPDSFSIPIPLPDLRLESIKHVLKGLGPNSILLVSNLDRSSPDVIDALTKIQPIILAKHIPKGFPLPAIPLSGLWRLDLPTSTIFRKDEIQLKARQLRPIHFLIQDYKKERSKSLD